MEDNSRAKKYVKIIIRVIGILIWMILAMFCGYSALHGRNMYFATNGVIFFTFFMVPYLFLGALYGYLIAMWTFVLTFIMALIFDMNNAYNMAIYLVVTICFSMFSQYFFFRTKKKTIIAASVTLALSSMMEMLCLSIVSVKEYNIKKFWDFIIYFGRDALMIFLVAFTLHFFFSMAPDICKMPFPLGIGYTKAYQENNQLKRSLRKTRVSMKITAIIIAMEVILGLSVAVFMVVLFPDIKDMFLQPMHREETRFVDRADDSPEEKEIIQGPEDATEPADASDPEDAAESADAAGPEDAAESADAAGPTDAAESENHTDEEQQAFIEHVEKMDFRFDAIAISYDIKMMLLILCVGVPLAAIANFYTKMTIGGPLGAMSDFMKEYAEADDEKKLEVGHKVDKMVVRTHDEIQVVHESMKETVHAIEEYITHINEEHELEKELEVAKKASEAKSSFLSNMSHEIRTPINAVLGLNEMILRECKDEQILEYAESVRSAGSSLLGIVNDILDFSKIEAGKMDILPAEYHIGSTINDLINLVSVKAEDKGLALEMNIDSHLPTRLIGDEIRIKQCVTNILTNAVKYTEEGTVTLNISYRKADEESIYLRFRVVDTGIGIKEEDLQKLYSPFERIEEIRNRTIEGTGLGMSIVKKLLALMDTRLEVKSVYGEGSDFSFEVLQKVSSWEELGDYREKYREFLKSRKKYKEKFRAPDADILVVDDTAINLTVVKGLLKSTLMKIDTAESGMEAISKVRKKKYDIIFIDHRMPEMDGLETLTAMKEMEDNLSKDTPCIALTANAGAGARDEYIAAGFNDYLSKPVNGELMEEMIRQYLPEEKVIEAGDDKAAGKAPDTAEDRGSVGDETENGNGERDVLDSLFGIDIAEAEKNCGSRELLKDVVREYFITIDSKADSIEKYAAGGDIRNYTVVVHALKSSSRLIGAMELSGMAAELEQAGNDGNEEMIKEKTPELLALFRSYKEKLSAIDEEEKKDDLPEIGKEELEGAFSDMKELLEAYDFDTADGIMNMLSEYRIPDDYREKYDRVRELMAAVDRDALLEVLS